LPTNTYIFFKLNDVPVPTVKSRAAAVIENTPRCCEGPGELKVLVPDVFQLLKLSIKVLADVAAVIAESVMEKYPIATVPGPALVKVAGTEAFWNCKPALLAIPLDVAVVPVVTV
jgi:hypothetical protein